MAAGVSKMYAHTYTYIHRYIHRYIHTYIHTCIRSPIIWRSFYEPTTSGNPEASLHQQRVKQVLSSNSKESGFGLRVYDLGYWVPIWGVLMDVRIYPFKDLDAIGIILRNSFFQRSHDRSMKQAPLHGYKIVQQTTKTELSPTCSCKFCIWVFNMRPCVLDS